MSLDDRIVRLLDALAALPADEREVIVERLSLGDRDALEALAEARLVLTGVRAEAAMEVVESFRWAASADLVDVLTQGAKLLDDLAMTATQPVGLLAALDYLRMEDSRALVAVTFAAILHGGGTQSSEIAPALASVWHEWERRVTTRAAHPTPQGSDTDQTQASAHEGQ